ncbi:MAG: S-layer homology domain-containing protein [Cuspidothrix sp.]
MKKLLGTLTLITLLQTSPSFAQTESTETILVTDSQYIQMVIDSKLMNNFPDGQFYAERLINRAELASVLVKAFYLDKRLINQEQKYIFIPDVPISHPAYQDIQIVLKTDIMKGYRGNMFFPNQRVTRAEGLAIFAQAYGVFQFPDDTVNEILSSHPDAKSIPDWAKKAIATVVAEEFINMDTKGNIYPLRPMTRGDLAYVLSKYLQRKNPESVTPEVPKINPF